MLRTNKIVDTKSILESRLKKSIIEFNYLISILLQNNYFKQNYSIVLNQIIIDKEIIKNPLYNFWIKTIKEIIRYNGINEENDYTWNKYFYTIDSNKYERIFDKLVLQLLSVRLFCDLAYSKNMVYKIKITLYDGFHIPVYYKLYKKQKISTFTTKNGKLYIDNKYIPRGTGCNNDFKNKLYFYNDSDLKFVCNNVPSIIIDHKKTINLRKLNLSFDILNNFFKNDIDELLNFCESAYMIHSNENYFCSGNDESNLGLIYLPNINDEYNLAECVLHELMHQKLCNIEDVALLFKGKGHLQDKYYSPWRNDPRPLRMILHGLFVFTGIIEFWQQLIQDNKLKKTALLNCYLRLIQNKLAIKILKKYATFTILGSHILERLIDINRDIELFINQKVPSKDIIILKNQLSEHRKRYKMYVS